MITRINGALYAPWLAFPFPKEVLSVPVPLPPPAPLPVPDEYKPAIGETLFRCTTGAKDTSSEIRVRLHGRLLVPLPPATDSIRGLFMSIVRATISPTILSKADRLFRNDDAGVFLELLQNARRAGATLVDISIEQLPGDGAGSRIIFHDNGRGIDDFQKLLTLGDSDWSIDVREIEDPAGMGFFSLCHSEVEVRSGSQQALLSREVFLGGAGAEVVSTEDHIPGTRIVFTRGSRTDSLVGVIRQVSEFCPVEVHVNGEAVTRHDFLEGADYREIIDGIEVGFGTSFKWRFGVPGR